MLPDGRTFLAGYKRVPRSGLQSNVILRRSYKTRGRPKGKRRRPLQKGSVIFSTLKKIVKNPLVRSIAKKGVKYAPGIYHNLPKRVRKKTLKRILNSD